MLTAIIIFLVTYVLIASEKVDKTLAALLGAVVMIVLRAVPYERALAAIDMNVIFLLLGMMVIVGIMAQTGVFEWLAIHLARAARGNGVVIMVSFLLMTTVISAFLDNVTTIIMVAPLTILVTQILEIPTKPLLILEAIFSNIGGTATLVGDPPNILIGAKADLSFNAFILNLAPVILIVTAVSVLVVGRIYWKAMRSSEAGRDRIRRAKPELAILQPVVLRRSLIVFGVVLLGFFLGRLVGIDPGLMALAGAVVMALVNKREAHEVLGYVEWNTIFFFVGLFMLIFGLEHNGVFEMMGTKMLAVTGGNLLFTALVILWFSAIASAIVDNIPLVMAMIPLVHSMTPVFARQMGLVGQEAAIAQQIAHPLFWSLALGACLGGNGTLVGASANVVISQIAKRNKQAFTFWEFTKIGFPLMILSLVICTGYIYLRYFAFNG
jgi:Na+/H+ antiporter NhaD/arsenite permease-like protein